MKFGDLRECAAACVKYKVACPNDDCRQWMEYEEDLNCALISVELNGKQTLREVSKRFGVSFVRIKQIQDAAVKKLTKRIPDA
tara:strand:+ start:1189 stop:1437 length:249 start_codon:yes stop_codon:yes gene_type:complete